MPYFKYELIKFEGTCTYGHVQQWLIPPNPLQYLGAISQAAGLIVPDIMKGGQTFW